MYEENDWSNIHHYILYSHQYRGGPTLIWFLLAQWSSTKELASRRSFCFQGASLTLLVLLPSLLTTVFNTDRRASSSGILPFTAAPAPQWPHLAQPRANGVASGTHLLCTGNASAWASSDLQERHSIMNPFGHGLRSAVGLLMKCYAAPLPILPTTTSFR